VNYHLADNSGVLFFVTFPAECTSGLLHGKSRERSWQLRQRCS